MVKHPSILGRFLRIDCESGYPVSDGSIWRVALERGALLRISNGEEGAKVAILLKRDGQHLELNVEGYRVGAKFVYQVP